MVCVMVADLGALWALLLCIAYAGGFGLGLDFALVFVAELVVCYLLVGFGLAGWLWVFVFD